VHGQQDATISLFKIFGRWLGSLARQCEAGTQLRDHHGSTLGLAGGGQGHPVRHVAVGQCGPYPAEINGFWRHARILKHFQVPTRRETQATTSQSPGVVLMAGLPHDGADPKSRSRTLIMEQCWALGAYTKGMKRFPALAVWPQAIRPGKTLMRAIWQDIRFGARMLAKHPGFTAIAVLTLALGIGAKHRDLFSYQSSDAYGRLPVQNPDELVILRAPGPMNGHVWSDGDEYQSFSYPMYKRLRETNQAFFRVAGALCHFPSVWLAKGRRNAAAANWCPATTLMCWACGPPWGGCSPLTTTKCPGAQPVVVLSHAYWTRRFGQKTLPF